ncbi:pupal cuticle protein [Cephus cinctus]|uniref:Pupal cuticle protein n=1 Tax=Cephus cinctus TaxID=211228 RepID=A0AAJ7BN78_CEPCN|nr:pupal cuticle protein [Cephus cinctus]
MSVTLVIFASSLALVNSQYSQYQDAAQNAAILTDARYLSGDGTFGAAYSQEDGVVFKEESDANGDRRGSYSYVDPTGKRHTVTYTAGKNGFQATGDHIPKAPPQAAPQPEYVPLPQYNSPDYQQSKQQYQPPAQSHYQPEPARRPQTQYQSQPQPDYEPQPQYQPASRSQPPYNALTTPAPHRFYPPGKLNFNRTPDGFSYTFSKS